MSARAVDTLARAVQAIARGDAELGEEAAAPGGEVRQMLDDVLVAGGRGPGRARDADLVRRGGAGRRATSSGWPTTAPSSAGGCASWSAASLHARAARRGARRGLRRARARLPLALVGGGGLGRVGPASGGPAARPSRRSAPLERLERARAPTIRRAWSGCCCAAPALPWPSPPLRGDRRQVVSPPVQPGGQIRPSARARTSRRPRGGSRAPGGPPAAPSGTGRCPAAAGRCAAGPGAAEEAQRRAGPRVVDPDGGSPTSISMPSSSRSSRRSACAVALARLALAARELPAPGLAAAGPALADQHASAALDDAGDHHLAGTVVAGSSRAGTHPVIARRPAASRRTGRQQARPGAGRGRRRPGSRRPPGRPRRSARPQLGQRAQQHPAALAHRALVAALAAAAAGCSSATAPASAAGQPARSGQPASQRGRARGAPQPAEVHDGLAGLPAARPARRASRPGTGAPRTRRGVGVDRQHVLAVGEAPDRRRGVGAHAGQVGRGARRRPALARR